MQSQTENAPPFERLTRALGDKVGSEVSEDDLRDEFQKYLDYGVPEDQAIKTILRHYGADAQAIPRAAPMQQERTPLADVPPNVPFVNLLVRLVTYNTKTVHARGEQKEIVWGLVGDETATRPYTSWRSLEGLQAGDVVAVKGAYTKEWNGEVQIQFGDRCEIVKQEAEALPKTAAEVRDVPVGELQPGDRAIRVTGRILDVQTRDIVARGEPKTIWEGTLADASGKVAFTSWHDHNLQAGQVVTIEGGYVRAFRGTPQFNFDETATITPSEADLPDAETLAETDPVPIADLVNQGANDVTVIATLLEVRDGSGLVFRDPETNRVVHGSQITKDSVPDLRIKGVVDDGTGAMNMVANRTITQALLGKDLETCQKEAQDAFRSEVIQEQLQEKLTGRVYKMVGNVLVDDYGAMFLVRTMEPYEEDRQAAAEALLAKLGGA